MGKTSTSVGIARLRRQRNEDRAEGKGQMSELEPTPELPDDTPIREVRFPTRIRNALYATGLKTVGEVREMSDEALLTLPDFGKTSVAQLRDALGLPSTDGVRPRGKKPSDSA